MEMEMPFNDRPVVSGYVLQSNYIVFFKVWKSLTKVKACYQHISAI